LSLFSLPSSALPLEQQPAVYFALSGSIKQAALTDDGSQMAEDAKRILCRFADLAEGLSLSLLGLSASVRSILFSRASEARYYRHEFPDMLATLSGWNQAIIKLDDLCVQKDHIHSYVTRSLKFLENYRLIRFAPETDRQRYVVPDQDLNGSPEWSELLRDVTYDRINPVSNYLISDFRWRIVEQHKPVAELSFIEALRKPDAFETLKCWPQLAVGYATVRVILANLLRNAFEAHTKGTPIVVCLDRHDDFAVIAIEETGEPYLRDDYVALGKPAERGVGLAVVSELMSLVAERWPGSAFIEPTRGATSKTFTIKLPVQQLGEGTLRQ